MDSGEIRKRFLNFFEKRGHAVLPSASLVPENDPSVLFTTAGMQPLVPYLLGEKHPKGMRLVNVQKCVRTGDIDDVGDNRHLTFFEMMGNWSLGDYFKKEAIAWSYELLTSKDEGFGLDPDRLYVTVFEGNEDAPKDEEAIGVWKSVGIPEHRIFPMSKEDNWWSPGPNGPAGPDSEMFYDLTPREGALIGREAFVAAQNSGRVVEIWNDVFMEYEQKDGKVVGKLTKQNVDTGSGLERMTVVLQGKQHVFETDLFAPLMKVLQTASSSYNEKSARIVADHLRAAVFMIADGVLPSNTDRGYVLRRLLRRAVHNADMMGLPHGALGLIAKDSIIPQFSEIYSELADRAEQIRNGIREEELKFRKTLERGLREFEKGERDAFVLFTSYGFPLEMTFELAKERGENIDTADFEAKMKEHQNMSRTAAEGMFKGGLGGDSEKIVRLHTATHLLNAALKSVLGEQVKQKGSNITEERLRFDFSHDAKMTEEQKKAVEEFVNGIIHADLPVVRAEMPREEAEKLGAEMEFGAKYPDVVSIYTIGNENTPVSREFCGGPHVTHTSELGNFKIIKEEASSAGVRRIKATLS
jgi:alanyl-tRNA synthetase